VSEARELPLLMGAGHGEPERLLLLGAPDERGMVHVRIWTSDDWSLPPRTRDEPCDGLLEWIESMARAGHSLNQSLTAVRGWLRTGGVASP
jgi:hypothetical protein